MNTSHRSGHARHAYLTSSISELWPSGPRAVLSIFEGSIAPRHLTASLSTVQTQKCLTDLTIAAATLRCDVEVPCSSSCPSCIVQVLMPVVDLGPSIVRRSRLEIDWRISAHFGPPRFCSLSVVLKAASIAAATGSRGSSAVSPYREPAQHAGAC